MMKQRLKYLINSTVSLFLFFSMQGAYSMQPVKYEVRYKANNTICNITVNGARAIGNDHFKGPVMGGLTVSAFLENGTNTVALEMAPFSVNEGINKYEPNAYCQLTARKVNLHKEGKDEFELFKLIGSVDKDLKPTGLTTADYEKNQVKEQAIAGTPFYQVSKTFQVSGLSEWKWVKATPFEPTEVNMEKLRQAYLEVWNTINSGNEKKFLELSHISFSEKETATNYPGSWYKSLDLDDDFKNSIGAMPINWDDYKLIVLNKGRLVKLEDSKGFSPLGFKNQNGKRISTYNPYFSLIDGKMIITR
ncbi:hypothetical protein [Entomomonas asaccharolytica]|uniref:Uncharacterized protein n=1 Tax=Entomomonas asaccharolytica TaxID=2785331 RepID=A0A974NG85_9GAMM|nr:hypothetical protein [Entomomonas asaccharolytica]QQP86035.1 hypothetical protein JHT90_01915 [Entomomonas asaccharolytica]